MLRVRSPSHVFASPRCPSSAASRHLIKMAAANGLASKQIGGRGEDDVCRYRESELNPREFECGQAEHDSSLSCPPAAASGFRVASKTSGAARTEAVLTIGLLTERSSSTTANAAAMTTGPSPTAFGLRPRPRRDRPRRRRQAAQPRSPWHSRGEQSRWRSSA
jgi:hypothetical protein